MNELDDILAHYGVPGMRWGVRRRDIPASTTPQDVVVKTKPGKGLVTEGGKGHPPAEDAKKAASVVQKAKASGLHSLSNQEIQQAVARMNLEQQYARITAKKQTGARAFISKLLVDVAKTEVSSLAKGQQSQLMKQLDAVTAKQSPAKHRKTK